MGDTGGVERVGFGLPNCAKPMVPPLAQVADSPLIGLVTEKVPVLVRQKMR